MNIGNQISAIRKEQQLTQEQFRSLFHVTRQTVSNWENEKRKIHHWFFTGAGTGIIVSCLLSPDSIRRTVVIIIGLVMIGIGWYKKTRYDNKVFRYMEEFKEDS